MVNTKYDYLELKKEFYASGHIELSPFLREKGILPEGADMSKLSGSMQKNFQGWAEEKKQWLEGLFYESKQLQGRKIKKEWDQVLDKVNDARKKILSGLAEATANLSDTEFKALLDKPDEILPLMRHFRLEAGESMDNSGNNINDRLIIALPPNGFESPLKPHHKKE